MGTGALTACCELDRHVIRTSVYTFDHLNRKKLLSLSRSQDPARASNTLFILLTSQHQQKPHRAVSTLMAPRPGPVLLTSVYVTESRHQQTHVRLLAWKTQVGLKRGNRDKYTMTKPNHQSEPFPNKVWIHLPQTKQCTTTFHLIRPSNGQSR